uniref:Translocon-associated protein subunit gamma n=1 Tax=Ditylenchus dipsaci TaxID=166011 RepID=A0A915DR33_9BILA
MSKTTKFTKEDELLLKDFSAAVSKTGTLTFYAVSTLVGLTPLYLFYEVHQMEIADSWFIWLAAVIGHQIVVKRGDAIAREMNRQLGDDKKMSKKEKDERILWKRMKWETKKRRISPSSTTIFCSSLYCASSRFSCSLPWGPSLTACSRCMELLD